MKQKLTPCNGTTSTPPKLVVALPSPHHSTLQWHPAMAPNNGTTSTPPKLVVTLPLNHSTLEWHPTMAHPGATSNPPKWFVALPPIGSKNPYSYRYLGKYSYQIAVGFKIVIFIPWFFPSAKYITNDTVPQGRKKRREFSGFGGKSP